MSKVVPIAIPGIHERFLRFFAQRAPDRPYRVLDVGAGHGAFSQTLRQHGYDVDACDLFPEIFHYDEIECTRADLTEDLPYPDARFDAIVALEVMEHILDHEVFFREARRTLKPGGVLYLSTPNILSLKSRLRFFLSGFYYSFEPLDLHNNDGLQHVASLTVDQYHYLAIRNGLQPHEVTYDKAQSTSRWLMGLYPLIWAYSKLKGLRSIHNDPAMLTGRIVFLGYQRPVEADSSPAV